MYHQRMKNVLITLGFGVAFAGAACAQTAYDALRQIGRELGDQNLNRVIEVTGRDGTPQPRTWRVLLSDPRARAGVREVEVQRGKIASQRTPVKGYSGRPENAVMDFQKLNLNSDGAF